MELEERITEVEHEVVLSKQRLDRLEATEMNSKDRKCEVCGEPATVQLCDVREIDPPKEDPDGKVWCEWQPSNPHNYCAQHKRPAQRYWLDGRVTE